MEDYAPFTFIGTWVLVAPYLCFRFRILDKLVLNEYVSQVERGPHSLQSCLCATQNGFPLATKRCTFFFKFCQLSMPHVYKHLRWTSTMTHLLSLSRRMIPFFQHLKPAFVLIQARGQGYGWLPGHIFIHFASHTLLSPQCCVFVSV